MVLPSFKVLFTVMQSYVLSSQALKIIDQQAEYRQGDQKDALQHISFLSNLTNMLSYLLRTSWPLSLASSLLAFHVGVNSSSSMRPFKDNSSNNSDRYEGHTHWLVGVIFSDFSLATAIQPPLAKLHVWLYPDNASKKKYNSIKLIWACLNSVCNQFNLPRRETILGRRSKWRGRLKRFFHTPSHIKKQIAVAWSSLLDIGVIACGQKLLWLGLHAVIDIFTSLSFLLEKLGFNHVSNFIAIHSCEIFLAGSIAATCVYGSSILVDGLEVVMILGSLGLYALERLQLLTPKFKKIIQNLRNCAMPVMILFLPMPQLSLMNPFSLIGYALRLVMKVTFFMSSISYMSAHFSDYLANKIDHCIVMASGLEGSRLTQKWSLFADMVAVLRSSFLPISIRNIVAKEKTLAQRPFIFTPTAGSIDAQNSAVDIVSAWSRYCKDYLGQYHKLSVSNDFYLQEPELPENKYAPLSLTECLQVWIEKDRQQVIKDLKTSAHSAQHSEFGDAQIDKWLDSSKTAAECANELAVYIEKKMQANIDLQDDTAKKDIQAIWQELKAVVSYFSAVLTSTEVDRKTQDLLGSHSALFTGIIYSALVCPEGVVRFQKDNIKLFRSALAEALIADKQLLDKKAIVDHFNQNAVAIKDKFIYLFKDGIPKVESYPTEIVRALCRLNEQQQMLISFVLHYFMVTTATMDITNVHKNNILTKFISGGSANDYLSVGLHSTIENQHLGSIKPILGVLSMHKMILASSVKSMIDEIFNQYFENGNIDDGVMVPALINNAFMCSDNDTGLWECEKNAFRAAPMFQAFANFTVKNNLDIGANGGADLADHHDRFYQLVSQQFDVNNSVFAYMAAQSELIEEQAVHIGAVDDLSITADAIRQKVKLLKVTKSEDLTHDKLRLSMRRRLKRTLYEIAQNPFGKQNGFKARVGRLRNQQPENILYQHCGVALPKLPELDDSLQIESQNKQFVALIKPLLLTAMLDLGVLYRIGSAKNHYVDHCVTQTLAVEDALKNTQARAAKPAAVKLLESACALWLTLGYNAIAVLAKTVKAVSKRGNGLDITPNKKDVFQEAYQFMVCIESCRKAITFTDSLRFFANVVIAIFKLNFAVLKFSAQLSLDLGLELLHQLYYAPKKLVLNAIACLRPKIHELGAVKMPKLLRNACSRVRTVLPKVSQPKISIPSLQLPKWLPMCAKAGAKRESSTVISATATNASNVWGSTGIAKLMRHACSRVRAV